MSPATRWSTAFILAVLILIGLFALRACVSVLLNRLRLASSRAEQAQWFDAIEAAIGRTRQWLFLVVWVLYSSFSTSRASLGFLVFYGALFGMNHLLRDGFKNVWDRLSHLDARGTWNGSLDPSDSQVARLGYFSYFLLIFSGSTALMTLAVGMLAYAVAMAWRNVDHADFAQLAVWELEPAEKARLERLGIDPGRVFRHIHLPEPVRGLPGGYAVVAESVFPRLDDGELAAVVEHSMAREQYLRLDKRLRIATYVTWFGVAVFASRQSVRPPGLLSVRVFAVLAIAIAATWAVNVFRRRQQAEADRRALTEVDDHEALGRGFERLIDVWFAPLVTIGDGTLSWWDRMQVVGHEPSIEKPQSKREVAVAGTIATVTLAIALAAGLVMPTIGLFGAETIQDVSLGTGRAPGSSYGSVFDAVGDVLRGRSPVDGGLADSSSDVVDGTAVECSEALDWTSALSEDSPTVLLRLGDGTVIRCR